MFADEPDSGSRDLPRKKFDNSQPDKVQAADPEIVWASEPEKKPKIGKKIDKIDMLP